MKDSKENKASELVNEPQVGSVTHLFALARQGDAKAFDPLWKRFFPRLVGLAKKRFSGKNMMLNNAEDAAQAALISFWTQIKAGDYLNDLCRGSLWNLLATITVRKVGKQLRQDVAVKRGGGRVTTAADLAGDQPIEELLGVLPTQELDLQAQELMEVLPIDLQEIVLLRLTGYSTKEISEQIGSTQRKVQRKLELVQLQWTKVLGDIPIKE